MNEALADANRQFLQQHFPLLVRQIDAGAWPSARLEAEVEPARNGGWTMRTTVQGANVNLHSQYDPSNEAKRWAAANPPANNGVCVLLGWGLGLHVLEWIKLYGKRVRAVIIFEPEADWFIQSMAYTEMQGLAGAERTEFVLGDDAQALYQALLRQMEAILSCDIHLLPLPFAPAYPSSVIHTLREEVRRILTSKEQILKHMATHGAFCQQHLIQNLPYAMRAWLPREAAGLAQGRPGIVVAAGPSLDKNIDQLVAAKEHAWIFACDTSLKPLLQRGVMPSMVVSKDPSDLNRAHFEGVDSLAAIHAALDPQVDPSVPTMLSGAGVYMPNRNHAVHAYIKGLELSDADKLPFSTNVAVAAFNMAVLMGCDPIVFVGLDLCFPVDSGRSHASNTALQSNVKFDPQTHKLEYTRGDARDLVDTITVEGVDGNEHPTLSTFYEALRLLEQLIAQSGRMCIDASEGGARIGGTEVMRLEDALAIYCQQPVDDGIFKEKSPPQRDHAAFQSSIREIVRHIEQCEATATDALQAIEKNEATLEELEAARRQIEDGYRLYHELQSALERVMVEIRRDGFFDASIASKEEIIKQYLWYFAEIRDACKRFGPEYQLLLQSTEN
ncbi:MAG: DUF115 domain-containing protein [Candidatus Hinthialibacter antarcticus]|nr:DUF115 domain-containing protein [Candidatus Hinthialibacter antarcticus]